MNVKFSLIRLICLLFSEYNKGTTLRGGTAAAAAEIIALTYTRARLYAIRRTTDFHSCISSPALQSLRSNGSLLNERLQSARYADNTHEMVEPMEAITQLVQEPSSFMASTHLVSEPFAITQLVQEPSSSMASTHLVQEPIECSQSSMTSDCSKPASTYVC
jgi:hypothetical protein